MSNYINKIMSNHVFNSESSEDLSYLYSDKDKNQMGGYQSSDKSDNSDNNQLVADSLRPNGGFPPIFIINAQDKEEEKNKNRQLALSADKKTISIKDILKSKK